MKKILLLFNILGIFLFSFSYNKSYEEKDSKIGLLYNKENNCQEEDSIVNISTNNKMINVSGIIVFVDDSNVYIATSYQNYNSGYHYVIIFSDYSKSDATIVGYAKEDSVLVLKANNTGNYCPVKYSRSKFTQTGEEVNIYGKNNYNTSIAKTIISATGVCINCKEEAFKHYYQSIIFEDLDGSFIGAGVFDKKGQLVGLITKRLEEYRFGIGMLDVDKLYVICYNLINYGKYNKNYIKYNLLNVNSLTNYEKYLYSLDEELLTGVLVSSVHYLNYIIGGLNLGMIIENVNGVKIDSCYTFDNELARYEKGTMITIGARTTNGVYKEYYIRL